MLEAFRHLIGGKLVWLAVAAFVSAAFAGPVATAAPAVAATNAPRATLTPFTSEAQLRRYLKRARRTPPPPPAPPPPSPAAVPADGTTPPADGTAPAEAVAADGVGAAQPSITNVQEAGVDEGGIV